jgi:hypothetical protein
VDVQRLCDDVKYRLARIQRFVRILKIICARRASSLPPAAHMRQAPVSTSTKSLSQCPLIDLVPSKNLALGES